MVSNSTPIAVNGKKVVLFHFETSIEGLRTRVGELIGGGNRARIIDLDTGLVIADTEAGPVTNKNFPAVAKTPSPVGMSHAVAAVPVAAGNQNRWQVEVFVPHSPSFTGTTLRKLALLLVIALTLLAALGVRAAHSIIPRGS